MLELISTTRLAAVLDKAAEDLLQSAKWDTPAVDAVAVARRLGLTVARDSSLNGRARYARLSVGWGRTRDAIFVGHAERPERLQWAVAHELGEIAVHRVAAQAGLTFPDDNAGSREQLANELARRILLPSRYFRRLGVACNWDLFELKRAFPSASHELIARRMLDYPQPVIITVSDHGQVSWRRGNQNTSVSPLTAEELSLMQAAHLSSEFQQHRNHLLWIRAWPVHEPGWKREILRSEPLEECGSFQ